MLHLAQESATISSIRCCFIVARLSIIVTIQRLALSMKNTDLSKISLRYFHMDPVPVYNKISLLTLNLLLQKC